MKVMKILVISKHNLGDNRIGKHLKTLEKNNYSVSYLNMSHATKEDVSNFQRVNQEVKLIHFNKEFEKKRFVSVGITLLKIRKALKKVTNSIVHIHDPLFLLFVKRLKRNKNIIVYDKHELYESFDNFEAKLGTYLEKKHRALIEGVVYVTQSQEGHLNKLGMRNIVEVPNYQLKAGYQVTPAPIKDNLPVELIYIGDLSSDSRDIDLMIAVFAKLLEVNKNIQITLGGSHASSFTSQNINSLSNKYSNFEYVGVIPYAQVILRTMAADIGFYFTKNHPNNYRSSPNKIYEYLISGTAIIGKGIFRDEELIQNKAGYLYNYEASEAEIVNGVNSLITNQELLKKFKAEARVLGDKFTWENVENRYIELYNKITGNHERD